MIEICRQQIRDKNMEGYFAEQVGAEKTVLK